MTTQELTERLDWPLPNDLADHFGLSETPSTVCNNLQETEPKIKDTQRIDSCLSHVSAALRDHEEYLEHCSNSDDGSMRSVGAFDFDGLDSCNFGLGPIFGSVAPRTYNNVHRETLLDVCRPGLWLAGGDWSLTAAQNTLGCEQPSAENWDVSESFEDNLKAIEQQKDEALEELRRYGSGEEHWKKDVNVMKLRRSSSGYSREPWEDKTAVRKSLTWSESYGKGERRKAIWMVEEDYTTVDVGASVVVSRLGLGEKLRRLFTLRKSKTW